MSAQTRVLWFGPWTLALSYNIDLEHIGLYNREPLKQSRSSRSHIFFKIGSLKISPYLQETCCGLFLIKLVRFLISRFHLLPSWSKSYTKCSKNNSLLSCDKIISSLLELIDHVLSISEYVVKKHWVLSILMKNLHTVLHK